MTNRFLVLGAILGIATAGDAAAAPPQTPAFVEGACPIDIPEELADRISCGTVSVPRDYERPEDGSFEIAVLVGRAVNPVDGAEPVFLDFGGWSSSQVSGGVIETRFRATTRDVVIVDKRGAGFSTPQMCPPTMLQSQVAAVAADLPLEATLAAMRTALLDCRAEMEARDVRPQWFGVRTSSRDLDRVRRALGYDRIMMIGSSHGGRQALDYLAEFPEHVAAAVIDSPSLPDPFLSTPSQNYDRALEVTFAACAAQAECAARFPELSASYRSAIASLDAEGLAIPLPGNPGAEFVINGADLELLLQQMLYSREGIAMVPAIIDAAANRQAQLLTPVVMAAQQRAAGNGEITGTIFECRDRPSLQSVPPVERGSDILGNLDGVCEHWSEPGEPSRLPTDSPVPVLVLAGGFDPVTPPAYARIAADAIGAQARYLELAQFGHGVNFSRCAAMEMIPAFFDDPQAELVDCGSQVPQIVFATPPRG